MRMPIQAASINRQASPIQMMVGQAGKTEAVNVEPSQPCINGHCYIHHYCQGDMGQMTRRQCRNNGYSFCNNGVCQNFN